MKIGTQVYLKGSVEAVELYQKAFGATLAYNVKNVDGSFFHAELFVDGEIFLAVSETDHDSPPGIIPPMQFGVEFEDEQGVLNAFEVLKTDANITLPLGKLPWSDFCASLVDKFGVYWYLSIPQHKPNE